MYKALTKNTYSSSQQAMYATYHHRRLMITKVHINYNIS